MATEDSGYLKWLRYSGASVCVRINPWHWNWIPRWGREPNDGWPSPRERTWSVRWIFLTVRVWVDDGSW